MILGIIQNAEPEIVKLVEDLVISHISGNCIILVALPMTGTVTFCGYGLLTLNWSLDDIENQKALRLAHQVDKEGKRTIGTSSDYFSMRILMRCHCRCDDQTRHADSWFNQGP